MKLSFIQYQAFVIILFGFFPNFEAIKLLTNMNMNNAIKLHNILF